MSAYIAYAPPRFYEALQAEGYTLPDGCGDIELLMSVDGIVEMKLKVIMTDALLGQIGRALARIATENSRNREGYYKHETGDDLPEDAAP